MDSALTVYAAIGNSDDRLTQAEWSDFASEFMATVRRHVSRVHGEWWSESGARWQNACIAFELAPDQAEALKIRLSWLRARFRQDSIAWSEVSSVDFI